MLQRTTSAVPGHRTLVFTLDGQWAGRASVVGNFNDWTPGALPLVAAGELARASVDLPHDYIAVFRYLGDGDVWFDEPEADFVDAGASVVLGDPLDELEGRDGVVERTGTPAERTETPAERSVRVAEKKKSKAKKAADKAVAKARKKSSDLAAKVKKASERGRKAAARLAKEQERAAGKNAKKPTKKKSATADKKATKGDAKDAKKAARG